MKYELKLSYDSQELLIESIQKTYFEFGDRGKMLKRKVKLPIEKDSANWIVLKGLNNMTCKIENQELHKGDVVIFASVGAGMNVNAFVYRY